MGKESIQDGSEATVRLEPRGSHVWGAGRCGVHRALILWFGSTAGFSVIGVVGLSVLASI